MTDVLREFEEELESLKLEQYGEPAISDKEFLRKLIKLVDKYRPKFQKEFKGI